MDAKTHQDYQFEKKRLDETKSLIRAVILAAESDRKDFHGNIKHALEELDHLDSSLSWVNILANANLLEMTKKHLDHLKNAQDKPYFARMDFNPEETNVTEKLYLGKTSLFQQENQEPVIVDWRSPIANLYYEGRLGKVTYEGNDGTYSGTLNLKRQYILDDGELDEIRDIDMTARDEMLQESLTTNADSRLKDIVSTIQAEQNQIIRAPMNKPLIVQGVAGSGKTTIALHRIAYVIYTYSESFDADHMMILAPNNLFLDYISEVLPELGVDAVRQKTFIDYVEDAVGKKLKFVGKDELLTTLMDDQSEELVEEKCWIAKFKGSMAFKQVLDAFISDKEVQMIPKENLMLERYKVFSAKRIHQLFFEEYTYLPPARRIEKLKTIIKKQGKSKIEEIIKNVEEVYDDKIEKALYGISDKEIRREKVVALSDKKDAYVEELKKESKSLIRDYIKKFPKIDYIKEYRELMTNHRDIMRFSQLEAQQCEWLSKDAELLKKRKLFSIEDAGALLYFAHRFNGIPTNLQMNNVIVDEAQDYSVFEFEVMKRAMGTEVFTILGDLSQGIHSYRGVSGWEDVIDEVFPNAQFKQLTQSYRTTVEIMTEANHVLDYLPENQAYKATPVVRHDKSPEFQKFLSKKELVVEIERTISKLKGKQYQSFSVIGKNENECKEIEKLMLKETKLTVQRLSDSDEQFDSDLVIVPSFLAKGLEFDVVFIALLDEEYTFSEVDVKLLYVAMTRALHRLFLFSEKQHRLLVEEINRIEG
ncbi:RNA polymerase recycling motor HelD [Salipaludibacillus sp. HK11]|uniref:RNA polymerase recycling motor HelD n=1 Tax=Salipaludibacillus sp. HK11 TaxID=3394320 RepID=UPI0039FC95ED